MTGRTLDDAGEAGAQAFAPVRQRRRPPLRAQHRVRRPRRSGAELGGRDPPHAAIETGLLEDRLGELRPRALASGRDVVDAERQVDDRVDRLGQVAR